jgi:tetratricopeptide (TPR) repeat protein
MDEAQATVDKLNRIQPDTLGALSLQVEIDRARKQPDHAVELIRAWSARPGLTPAGQTALARLAERLDRFDLAEQFHRKAAAQPNDVAGKVALVEFLVRRRPIKDVVDYSESLWKEAGTRDLGARIAVGVLSEAGAADPVQKEQAERVAGWLESALEREPRSTNLLSALGSLRERQGRYPDAEALYRRAVAAADRDWVSLNNLAWLTALKDNKGREALDYINRAIAVRGPQPEFLDTRGVVYVIAGEGENAVKDLEVAVKDSPKANRLFHLAQAYLKVNDKEKAKKSLELAKAKGLPAGLHDLELTAYRKVLDELGKP